MRKPYIGMDEVAHPELDRHVGMVCALFEQA